MGDFSCEHLFDDYSLEDQLTYGCSDTGDDNFCYTSKDALQVICDILNHHRFMYLETKDKKYWWQMIQLLPSSYNQRRTVMLNYEVLANIYKSRKDHKLDEWRDLCEWIETLPYSELITGNFEEEKIKITYEVNIEPGLSGEITIRKAALNDEILAAIAKDIGGIAFDRVTE